MGAGLVRSFLGPEYGHKFWNRFFTDLISFLEPPPEHKLCRSQNLGRETDGSTQVHSMAPVGVHVTAFERT